MNIFYLHKDPNKAAEAMINKHVVKMILESAQLLSTAHRVLDGKEVIKLSANNRRMKRWEHPDPILEEQLYKSTHINHPSAIWARESNQNYQWLYEHFIALNNEYKKRYGKNHLSVIKLQDVLKVLPQNIPSGPFTEPTPAMPDQYKKENNSLMSYHSYYVAEKLRLGTDEDRSRFYNFVKENS
jgi:hypothetical protein